MKIRNDAKIKYHMKSHRLCASYPDENDVIFDMAEYVMSANKRKKTWVVSDFRIKSDGLKDVFPDISDDNFKEKIKTILAALHKSNNIVFTEDAHIAITLEGLSKIYSLQ